MNICHEIDESVLIEADKIAKSTGLTVTQVLEKALTAFSEKALKKIRNAG